MPHKKKRKNTSRRTAKQFEHSIDLQKTSQKSVWDFNLFEFHRHGLTYVPGPDEKTPGVSFLLIGEKRGLDEFYCSCQLSKNTSCSHFTRLCEFYNYYIEQSGGRTPYKDFRASIWYRLAEALAENGTETPDNTKLQFHGLEDTTFITAVCADGEELLRYYSRNPDSQRLLERFVRPPSKDSVPSRFTLLNNLAEITTTEEELIMAEHGMRSIGQELEKSFWYRYAYHCHREFGQEKITFHSFIDDETGLFTLSCKQTGFKPFCLIAIPRNKVQRILFILKDSLLNQHGMTISPIPLKSIFNVSMNTELDLEIRPLIKVLQNDGEDKFFAREDLEKFRYGNLVYIKEMGILAELEKPGGKTRKFGAPVKMVLKETQIPAFLDELTNDTDDDRHVVDASVKNLTIFKNCDSTVLYPESLDRNWCWLSMQYSFGDTSVSLGDILSAKKENHRFISIPGGWVDCQSPDFGSLDSLTEQLIETHDNSGRFKISLINLFRLRATRNTPVNIIGNSSDARKIRNLFELKPSRIQATLKGLRSSLRDYQKTGTMWLQFLYENGFGGLLCDDMGLGKTHQIMALMLMLYEHGKIEEPCIVICPTTVLSHWSRKISDHAPGLDPFIYHGGQRDYEQVMKHKKVVLTSFGIMRNDIEILSSIPFALAVFDEIQNLKNSQTISFRAAAKLSANSKIGLTGTPIENNLTDLKSLFDLVLPGYLGSDEKFSRRYNTDDIQLPDTNKRDELRKLIYPFMLRRLKQTVLSELPPKIEDVRTCTLSETQVKLYRDVINSRTGDIRTILSSNDKSIPYMHIFAVLNMLKQICDHPAVLSDSVHDYKKYSSGKWDLFEELICECLDSGQKIVVFSQYLKMIEIMELYLKDLGVEFVTLTGSTRNRGDIISRFNDDEECRCFLGSIKAGGTGIDLVAASVVIHYDRWWNAAREDQATDRVHRIGQKKSVQVFKLVTEGTLEENIASIIDKKRRIMDSVVQEDDPGLLKKFSRENLLSMLSLPYD